MALEDEIKAARMQIVPDGYDMSLGELISLYKQGELVINPEFQRYYRWEDWQKSKFVESILLGIPVPPVFVFQTEEGIWELVDGLQRLSTIFQLAGVLKTPEGNVMEALVLDGTKYLPSLDGKRWNAPQDANEEDPNGPDILSGAQQIDIKRARMRVEILKKGSDPFTKFELFQRLNTGGSSLSEQEVRNCVMVMINPDFYRWVSELSRSEAFAQTASQSLTAERRQKPIELVLRFIVFRHVPYTAGIDVHEYLDAGTINLANRADFDREQETRIFTRTFELLNNALGGDAFKRYDADRFQGAFSLSAFEFIAIGVARNIDTIEALGDKEKIQFVRERVQSVWTAENFRRYSGGGVRGTTRVMNLLPHGAAFFQP